MNIFNLATQNLFIGAFEQKSPRGFSKNNPDSV